MDLTLLNPWWEAKEAINRDKHIEQLARHKYIYEPELLQENFRQANIYTIRGPRQVGKTTFLKQLIRKWLKKHEPKEIFYWSCDNLSTRDDLIELLAEYSGYCKANEINPRYVCLDEITGLAHWQKAIKFIVDNNIISACIILTGSNAIDLKKGSERLPGRRGRYGTDHFFMPLSFRQYVKLIDKSWFEEHKDDSINKLRFHNDKLRLFFNKYLKTGGIPLVINEYEKNKSIPNYIHELYYSWIIGDILKEGTNEQALKEIIKSVLITYTTPISWDSIAKRSAVKSHITVSSYTELLENLIVLFSIYFQDVSEKKVKYRKNKKIYFFDPFILHMFSERFKIKTDDAKTVEGIVGSFLKQRHMLDDLYYTKTKQETDFVVDDIGIEVKYQNKIEAKDFRNKGIFKKYRILSKDTFGHNIIPVHAFLFSKDKA